MLFEKLKEIIWCKTLCSNGTDSRKVSTNNAFEDRKTFLYKAQKIFAGMVIAEMMYRYLKKDLRASLLEYTII